MGQGEEWLDENEGTRPEQESRMHLDGVKQDLVDLFGQAHWSTDQLLSVLWSFFGASLNAENLVMARLEQQKETVLLRGIDSSGNPTRTYVPASLILEALAVVEQSIPDPEQPAMSEPLAGHETMGGKGKILVIPISRGGISATLDLTALHITLAGDFERLNHIETQELRQLAKMLKLGLENRVLKEQSERDMMTGLTNERGFIRHLSELLERFLPPETPHTTQLCVAVLDMNGFKHINDTYGHEAGDDALKQFAAYFDTCIRPGDIAAHPHGDEWWLLFHVTPSASGTSTNAEAVITMIQQRLSKFQFKHRKALIPISVTIGYAALDDRNGLAREALRRRWNRMKPAERTQKTDLLTMSFIEMATNHRSDCELVAEEAAHLLIDQADQAEVREKMNSKGKPATASHSPKKWEPQPTNGTYDETLSRLMANVRGELEQELAANTSKNDQYQVILFHARSIDDPMVTDGPFGHEQQEYCRAALTDSFALVPLKPGERITEIGRGLWCMILLASRSDEELAAINRRTRTQSQDANTPKLDHSGFITDEMITLQDFDVTRVSMSQLLDTCKLLDQGVEISKIMHPEPAPAQPSDDGDPLSEQEPSSGTAREEREARRKKRKRLAKDTFRRSYPDQ